MHPTRRKMDTQRENHTHLFGSLYVVRTQAGLRQALKHFLGSDPDTTDSIDLGIPTAYPMAVQFDRRYMGGIHGVFAHYVHVNELKAKLENQ